jgi:nucleoside-diphosphate-sugar epimerase
VAQLALEQYGRVFHELYDLSVTSLRLFRTFGPEEDADRSDSSVAARFIRAALDGTSPVIYGDGHQTRDLVYVDNVVAAIQCALVAEPSGAPLNVASGEAVALNFLWTQVLDLCGKRRLAIDPTYVSAPPWEVQHARPQISRACRALRWAPSVRLREGLSRTINHELRLRSADPNAWFTPPTGLDGPARARTPPPVPRVIARANGGARDEALELSDEDMVEDPAADLEVEWAPVPAVPGLR